MGVAEIAAIVTAAAVVAGTAYTIASAPGTPEPPKAPAPPPPPPPPPGLPPPAPTPALAEAGIERRTRQRARQFGVQNTLLTPPTGASGATGASLLPMGSARRQQRTGLLGS